MNKNRILTFAFSASIALNLFFLGALSAKVLHHRASEASHHRVGDVDHDPPSWSRGNAKHGRPNPGPPGPMKMVRDLVQVMGGRHDPRVAETFKLRRPAMKMRSKEIRAAHQELTDTLTAASFSKSRLEAVLERLNAQTLSAQQDAQKAVVQLAEQLTPEERAKLKTLMTKRRDTESKLR